jgi:hypothetical protein
LLTSPDLSPYIYLTAARLAVHAGAAGIIVSNHGARQLDYVPATISALEEVRAPFLLPDRQRIERS